MNRRNFHYLELLIAGLLMIALLTVPVGARNLSIFDLEGGVRQLGMGDAFTGLADDGYTLYYNSAGFAYLDGMSVGSFYSSQMGLYGATEIHLASKNYGLGLSSLSIGGIQTYDSTGTPTGVISYKNQGLTAGFGMSWKKLAKLIGIPGSSLNFALGSRLKYYSASTTKGGLGSGWAMDWSILFDLGEIKLAPIEQIKAGMTISNLLSSVNYGNGYSENWGIGLRLGGSFVVQEVVTAIDVELLRETKGHLGIEFGPIEDLKVRAGTIIGSAGLSLTTGLGYSLEGFVFDYAYITHPIASGTHRLALSMDLGALGFNPSKMFAPLANLF